MNVEICIPKKINKDYNKTTVYIVYLQRQSQHRYTKYPISTVLYYTLGTSLYTNKNRLFINYSN